MDVDNDPDLIDYEDYSDPSEHFDFLKELIHKMSDDLIEVYEELNTVSPSYFNTNQELATRIKSLVKDRKISDVEEKPKAIEIPPTQRTTTKPFFIAPECNVAHTCAETASMCKICRPRVLKARAPSTKSVLSNERQIIRK